MGGPATASYYAFSPHPAWRFVMLDAYDVSLLGWPQGDPRHSLAVSLLDRHNPNEVTSPSLAALRCKSD